MSWGVATQNGVSVSLASIVSLSCGATEFSPASLFTSGVAGAWYDPSDTSTLFQDSAGTTPVTAVEQPVGLMLDKSQGLVLGSELVTNGDFSGGTTGWTADRGGSLSVVSGALRVTQGAVTDYAVGYQAVTLVVGQWYRLTVDFVGGTAANVQVGVGTSFTAADATFLTTATSPRTLTVYFAATATTMYVRGSVNVTADNVYADFDNFSLKNISGNHALQATSASRPILRARYNLLTYSEQFDNAAWVTSAATVTANSTTAPDGTTTADTITFSSVAGRVQRAVNMASQCISIYAKPIVGTRFAINTDGVSGADATIFNLSGSGSVVSTGANNNSSVITALADGWYRIVTARGSTAGTNIYLGALNSGGGSTDSFYIWGADLRTGSSAGTYQRIAAATDYATAGFLPYLALSTDDSFGTNSIDFTATDKMSVCAGVTKLSDAAAQIVCELSATSSAGNNGSFAIISALSPSNYAFYLYGTALASRIATTYASPVTNVLSVKYDISQATVPNEIAPQINGAVPTLADAGGAGTGNFGNYPLYIGRRNNASLPFNGNLYQLVVVGKTLSASELASTEAYVNSKTGAY